MASILHMALLTSATVVTSLLSAVWEGSLLVALIALSLRILPGLSAAVRSVIWMGAFALLVLLHIAPAIPQYRSAAFPLTGAFHATQVHPVHLDLRWSLALACVWATLSLCRGAQLILGAIRLRQQARRAIPVVPDEPVQALLRQGGRSAELCTSTEVQRPSVFGFFQPRILVPPDLLERLSAAELQQVVLHEMEHLHRRDDWTNLLQKIGLMLFPLNPALLWVERRLCAERELACDDRVLQLNAGRKAYAICLTHLAEYTMLNRGLSLVLGAWERQSELVRRVHRILRRPVKSMSGRPAMVAAASLMVGALSCALVLGRSPQLVAFAPLAQGDLAQAFEGPPVPRAALRQASFRGSVETPHLIETLAVLPQPEQSQAHYKAKPVRSVPKRKTTPQPVPNQQAWFVLTEWRDDGALPSLRLAVAPDPQFSTPTLLPASYAVVRLADGWLILKI